MVDNKLVFCSYGDGEVILWQEDPSKKQIEVNKRFKVFEKGDIVASSLSWSFDNSYVSAASKAGDDVPLMDTKHLAVSERLNSESLFGGSKEDVRVTCACFLGTSNQILVGSSSSVVAHWDIESKSRLKLFEGYSSPVSCLTRKAKDSLLVAGLEDGCITLHNMSSPSPKATLSVGPDHKESVRRVVFSPYDHGMLGSCGSSGAVRLWSVESQRLLTTFAPPHTKGANDVAFSPYNRKLVASVGGDMQIRLYDVQQRKLLTQIPSTVSLCSLLLMRDGVTLVAGGIDGNLYFYNLKNCKKPEYSINGHRGHPVAVMALQNVVKGNRSSRKLPSSRREKKVVPPLKAPSPLVMGGEDPSPSPLSIDSLLQTPSPTLGTSSLIASILPSSETPLPSSGLSAIFSPLDAPSSSSFIPKAISKLASAKDPPNIASTVSEPKKTVSSSNPTQMNEPLFADSSLPNHVRVSNGQLDSVSPDITTEVHVLRSNVTPLLATPIVLTAQAVSTSIGIFSPLDGMITTTTVSSTATNSPPPPSSVTTTTSSYSGTTVHPRPPVPKRISPKSHTVVQQGSSSPRPKRVSPTLRTSSHNPKTSGTHSSQQESTIILRENPTGSLMESSTLLNSKVQSNLPSPDMKSTPLATTQLHRPHPPPVDQPTFSSTLPISAPIRTMPTTPIDPVTPPPTTSLPAVHIQYLENLIRESQEET